MGTTVLGWFQVRNVYVAAATGHKLDLALYSNGVPARQGFNADLFSLSTPR